MTFQGFDFYNFYLWITLFGFFGGSSLSFLIAKQRKRSITFFLILLSISILLGLMAFAVAGFNFKLTGFQMAWILSTAFLGFFSFKFIKSIGIPLLVLFCALIVFVNYSFSKWEPVNIDEQIVKITILSQDDGILNIEYSLANEIVKDKKLKAKIINPDIDLIKVPEYFFLTPKRMYYRFYGFFEENYEKEETTSEKILTFLFKLPEFYLSKRSSEIEIKKPKEEISLYFEGDSLKIKKIEKNYKN